MHDNVNDHQDNTCDQHVNTFTLIGSELVVMVLRAILSRSLCSHSFSFSAMIFRFPRELPGFVYLGRLLSLTSLRFCRKMNTEVVIDKRIPDK